MRCSFSLSKVLRSPTIVYMSFHPLTAPPLLMLAELIMMTSLVTPMNPIVDYGTTNGQPDCLYAQARITGMDVQRRTAATLEVESGLNDPVAVFLTVLFTEYLIAAEGAGAGFGEVILRLVLQMAGGAIVGVAGGYLLTRLINRLSLAAGLYPILALSLALVIFGGALAIGASGFLAVYAAGVVLGNSRHREAVSIDRFHDGMAWLAQIALFLMLGLLITPHELLRGWDVALALSLPLETFSIFTAPEGAIKDSSRSPR